MDISRIQELSQLYNEVALFFSKYELQLCQEDQAPGLRYRRVFKPNPITCTEDDFRIWYENFKEALSVLVSSCSKETVQDIIGYYFKSREFVPDGATLLDCKDGHLIGLREAFVEVTKFINGFIDKTVWWYGVLDYYDSFKQSIMSEEDAGVIGTTSNTNLISEQPTQPNSLPRELDTDEAKSVLQRGVVAGLLDENYQCLSNMTGYQKREFADLASSLLSIRHKWRVFESLWGIKGLGQIKMYEANVDSINIIKRLFPEVEIKRKM